VQLFAGPKEMFKRNRTHGCGNDVDVLFLGSTISSAPSHVTRVGDLPDPIGKFFRIGYSGGEENNIDMFRQHDDDFFPYHSSLH